MNRDLLWKSGLELRDMILDGKISAIELIYLIFERINEVNPLLNAIVTLDRDGAIKQAEEVDKLAEKGVFKPLLGIPITIKDNIHTKGIRTTYGSILFKDFVPDGDAVIVERLKEAGAIIIGKTNLPELGLIAITDNPLFGVTKNPWDTSRTPGGSSGGSAVAVATGMSPISIGNDGGGSIRIPASFCGIYGFKPSTGRVPAYPKLPVFIGLATDGPITRYVADAALIMDVISGPDYRDKLSLGVPKEKYLNRIDIEINNVKIAFSKDLGYAVVDPEVEDIVTRAAYNFETLGAEVEEVKIEIPNMENALVTKVVAEVYTYLKDKLEEWKKIAFKPYLTFLAMAEYITITDYINIDILAQELWHKIMKIFKKYDYLITPTIATPPFKLEDGIAPQTIAGKSIGPIQWMPFTYPFNFTGQPAANIPVGLNREGLPVGMQIVGKPYDDIGVLMLSRNYEKKHPWHKMKPKI